MELFDKIERIDDKPAPNAESEYSFINRTSRLYADMIRNLLEDWFTHYPDFEKKEFLSRFRTDDDVNHLSSLFELFLHEMLLKLNCKIEVHPKITTKSTKHPDFIVETYKGDKFYLEAVISTNKSNNDMAAEKRMNEVYDTIDRNLDSPDFFICMELKGFPKTPPSGKYICSFLKKKLVGLDPDEMGTLMKSKGIVGLPHWLFEHDGWKIQFYPLPKRKDARGKKGSRPIGTKMYGVQGVFTGESLKKDLIAKANKYGKLELPYVIAINSLEWSMEHDDVMQALFGDRFEMDVENAVGLWKDRNRTRYSRVSAVLAFSGLRLDRISKTRVRLYHNPWAGKIYESVLTSLPQAIPDNNAMFLKEGRTLCDVMGLPDNWPKL